MDLRAKYVLAQGVRGTRLHTHLKQLIKYVVTAYS